MTVSFPFSHHPCWSSDRIDLWERIHLPVAIECNLQCNFCSNRISSCASIGPGGCKRTMTPEEAISKLILEMKRNSNLNIVAISGPGEPLFNESTFITLERVQHLYPDAKICLSTNGVLLSQSTRRLQKLGVDTISVSMSAMRPETVEALYSWGIIDDQKVKGTDLGLVLPDIQLKGIRTASNSGINIKVNTILIPSLNEQELPELSKRIKIAGASLQNVIPLIPRGSMSNQKAPSKKELNEVRTIVSRFIPQFLHCKQCRSDVVGLPGCDRILT